MEELYLHIFALNDECVKLCKRLEECLVDERRHLIEFKISELPQATLRKESIIMAIVRKKRELREFLKFHFGTEKPSELEEKLEEPFKSQWKHKREVWLDIWSKTRNSCQENQDFLKHSLKNMGLLVDNLKKVFGEHSVYSPKGKRIDMQKEGKVVEAKY